MTLRLLLLPGRGGRPELLDGTAAKERAGCGPGAGLPGWGQELLQRGASAALLAGDGGDAWLSASHASGWIADAASRLSTDLAGRCERHLEAGWVPADAVLLALGEAQGASGFELPRLTWGDRREPAIAAAIPEIGLYAIVDSVPRLRAVAQAGVPTVQLRIKTPPDADRAWFGSLARDLREAVQIARGAGTTLVVNDHWRLAADAGAPAIHLGQEDLGLLDVGELAELAASGLALGVSSHAMWELCRARSLRPASIACGPVWPTTTKDMPWQPQGLDNLAWWCSHAGAPVTAIGGILTAGQVRQAACAGASGVCVLRGLGDEPRNTVPALLEAFAQGRAEHRPAQAPEWPHPTLESTA